MARVEKPSVLVIDDNEATGTLITALLQRDFSVEIATDGVEAVERLKTSRYAAILLDLRMPRLDGFQVLEFLAEHSPEVIRRVLVLTAALTDRELARARTFEVFTIMPKPFDVEELLAAVKQCSGLDGGGPFGRAIYSSTGVILLLADLLRTLRAP